MGGRGEKFAPYVAKITVLSSSSFENHYEEDPGISNLNTTFQSGADRHTEDAPNKPR